jgi:hypothetical protein
VQTIASVLSKAAAATTFHRVRAGGGLSGIAHAVCMLGTTLWTAASPYFLAHRSWEPSAVWQNAWGPHASRPEHLSMTEQLVAMAVEG